MNGIFKITLVLTMVMGLSVTTGFADTLDPFVTYSLDIHVDDGTFKLYGEASLGDNSGIASISVPLTGSITSFVNEAPKGSFGTISPFNVSELGFKELRASNDGIKEIDGVFRVLTSVSLSLTDSIVVFGFGQEDGSLESKFNELDSDGRVGANDEYLSEAVTYKARLLLASGTYDLAGDQPTWNSNTTDLVANVFSNQATFGDYRFVIAQINTETNIIGEVPEPASLVMLGIGSLLLAGRRRRAG